MSRKKKFKTSEVITIVSNEKEEEEVTDPLYADINTLMKSKELKGEGKSEEDSVPITTKEQMKKAPYHRKFLQIFSSVLKTPLFVQSRYWKYNKRIILCGDGSKSVHWYCEAVYVKKDDTIGYLLFNHDFGQVYSTTDARDNDGQFFLCNVNPKHYKGKQYADKFVFYIDKEPETNEFVITNLHLGKLMTGAVTLPFKKKECATVLSNSFYGRDDSVVKNYYYWKVKVTGDVKYT